MIRSPRTATAPFSMTRLGGADVRTQRALQIQSAGSAPKANAASRKLQKRRIEWPWEQIFEPKRFRFSVQIDQNQLHVAAELPQDLPACPARRRECIGVRRHGHAREL